MACTWILRALQHFTDAQRRYGGGEREQKCCRKHQWGGKKYMTVKCCMSGFWVSAHSADIAAGHCCGTLRDPYLAVEGAAFLLEHLHLRTHLPGGGWRILLRALPVHLHWALRSHHEQSTEDENNNNVSSVGKEQETLRPKAQSSTVWLEKAVSLRRALYSAAPPRGDLDLDQDWWSVQQDHGLYSRQGAAYSFRTPATSSTSFLYHMRRPVWHGTPCIIRYRVNGSRGGWEFSLWRPFSVVLCRNRLNHGGHTRTWTIFKNIFFLCYALTNKTQSFVRFIVSV